ncbi:hypothetical protein ONE63_002455 [Megalurothrips usitatus]|uniref:Uncharacterized protein n=1 Tax=Megalurothrips usitatus TaxID=439358 RepID=A0AAV7X877_9NEOP|nr:hypothetical protein ONE63_002455 [Megalurothrips usitatus]
MGRISALSPAGGVVGGGGHLPPADALRALFRAHYQKLVNDYPYPEYKDKDNSPRFVAPATPAADAQDEHDGEGVAQPEAALTYCCRHCGQSDKLQKAEGQCRQPGTLINDTARVKDDGLVLGVLR